MELDNHNVGYVSESSSKVRPVAAMDPCSLGILDLAIITHSLGCKGGGSRATDSLHAKGGGWIHDGFWFHDGFLDS